jgi:membrane protein YqaA with SNARE-associated domain
MLDYLILFLSAFGAATLLPFYSEITLYALMDNGHHYAMLWLIASLGNSLGAVVNWWLGRYMLHYQDRKWFPFKASSLDRAQTWFNRWGVWSLLLAWLPLGGDALTFIAGLMRIPFLIFFVLTFIGKASRYAAVIWVFS